MIYYLAALIGLAISSLLVGELKLNWEDPFNA